MASLRTGSCPRCGGNLMLDSDIYGWFEKCLQCAWENDLEVLVESKEEPQDMESVTAYVASVNDQSEVPVDDIKRAKYDVIRRFLNLIKVTKDSMSKA